jgi:hypothetical protein
VHDAAISVAAPSVAVETTFAMLAGQSWEDSWSEVADFGGLASGGGVCGGGGGGGRYGIAGGCGVGGDAGGAGGCWGIIDPGGRCRITTGGGGDDGLGSGESHSRIRAQDSHVSLASGIFSGDSFLKLWEILTQFPLSYQYHWRR